MSKWLSSWTGNNHRTSKLIQIDKNTNTITFGFDINNDQNTVFDVRVGTGPNEPENYNLYYHYYGNFPAGITTFLFLLTLSRQVLAGENLYISCAGPNQELVSRLLFRNLLVNTDGGGTPL